MTNKLMLIILLIFFQTNFTLEAKIPSNKYTIHASELEHTALIRLADIFTLIDEWNYFTIDGFTIQARNQQMLSTLLYAVSPNHTRHQAQLFSPHSWKKRGRPFCLDI